MDAYRMLLFYFTPEDVKQQLNSQNLVCCSEAYDHQRNCFF